MVATLYSQQLWNDSHGFFDALTNLYYYGEKEYWYYQKIPTFWVGWPMDVLQGGSLKALLFYNSSGIKQGGFEATF